MGIGLAWFCFGIGVASATMLHAQPHSAVPPGLRAEFTFERIASTPDRNAIPLQSDTQGSASTEIWDKSGTGERHIRNITRPTLTPVLPSRRKSTGAAIIVAPGGGFMTWAGEKEGWPIAKWFADRGIAAFVLKYRLLDTPVDEQDFSRQILDLVMAVSRGQQGAPDDPAATRDALTALRTVRENASRWRVDPNRVGIIGFSAGAIAALKATLEGQPRDRPAFIGYIYGPMQPVNVPAGAPPMFAALAMDDPVFGGRGFGIIDSWHRAGVPVELHAYERGSHGFGMGVPGTTTTMMLPEFYAWVQSRGLLKGNAVAQSAKRR